MRAGCLVLLVALGATGWWGYRLYRQDVALDIVEAGLAGTLHLTETGCLREADHSLGVLDSIAADLRAEWPALPIIRKRAVLVSSHLQNLRNAWTHRAQLVDRTAIDAAVLVQQGNLAAAVSLTQAALDGADTDESLLALHTYAERLAVQDFSAAAVAAVRSDSLLREHVALSPEALAALPQYGVAVQRQRDANYAAHQEIATAVRSLISTSRTIESSEFRPVLYGKAMIWDATKRDVEMAYQLLPDNLRATSQDGRVTIFSIIAREQILAGLLLC